MNKERDKDIDKLFKRGLENPFDETGFMEDDWDALEQMLDSGKKRRGIVFWLPLLSAVAALVLLFFGWWMFRPQVTDHQQKQQMAVNHNPEKAITGKNNTNKPGTNEAATKSKTTIKQERTVTEDYAKNTNKGAGRNGVKNNSLVNLPPNKGANNYTETVQNNNQQIAAAGTDREQANLTAANQGVDINRPVAANSNDIPAIASVDILAKTTAAYIESVKLKAGKNGPKKAGLSYRPQYALSVIASPEVNGVNSFAQNSAGSNFGLLFSAGMLKKFTISTGVSYSTKPYATSFANYHTNYQFKTDPQSINADCRVLDIPVNIDYQLYNKHLNKISIGSGVSSYIMMHESYEFNYADPSTTGPQYFNVKNPNKYLFSILNLQATYQHQINSKVGISLQPYLKLPLSTIGASQVRLQTAGLAVGLNWNLNSLTKP